MIAEHLARRALLATTEAPATRLDYLAFLTGEAGPVEIEISYVPDKRLLAPAAFSAYLAMTAGETEHALEALALAILDDVNNELVPRWVRVTARLGETAGRPRHRVLVEDRQPKWNNPSLLSRIPNG